VESSRAFQEQSPDDGTASADLGLEDDNAAAATTTTLATANYAVAHLQTIADPLVFLAAEFLFS